MSELLEGKAALVTGAGSGIGGSLRQNAGRSGAQVLVADVDVAAAERVAGEIGPPAVPFRADVSDAGECEAMVAAAVEHFGALHVAVINAGIAGPSAPAGEYPPDGWGRVLAVHLGGTCSTAAERRSP